MLEKAREKLKRAREVNSSSTQIIKETAKAKLKKARQDPKLIALIIVDVLLIMLIILSLFFLFDPNLSLETANIPWLLSDNPVGDFFSSLFAPQLSHLAANPIPWEIKLLLFVVTVFIAFRLYKYTEWYRKQR